MKTSKWPIISLCSGSLNPEFGALLSHSKWLILLKNHRVAALFAVGTQHPLQSPVLHVLANLREVYSGMSEGFKSSPSVPAGLGKDLISTQRPFLLPGSGTAGTSKNESPFILRALI